MYPPAFRVSSRRTQRRNRIEFVENCRPALHSQSNCNWVGFYRCAEPRGLHGVICSRLSRDARGEILVYPRCIFLTSYMLGWFDLVSDNIQRILVLRGSRDARVARCRAHALAHGSPWGWLRKVWGRCCALWTSSPSCRPESERQACQRAKAHKEPPNPNTNPDAS